MSKQLRIGLVVLLAAALLAGCGGTDSSGSDDGPVAPTDRTTVLVFAAASLTDAFAEMETAFEKEHPAFDLVFNFEGSSGLREQILEGAPADVFASANQSNMDAVVAAGEVDGDAAVFARNVLQIAVPAGNPAGVTGLADFADADLLIGLCAEGVPCGDFALEALSHAGVEPSVDTYEPDVRSLLTKVASDELDAGVVYVTDVLASDGKVEGIDIPDADNVVASYPIAPLAGAPNPDGAAAFVGFVLSNGGRTILASYGFAAP